LTAAAEKIAMCGVILFFSLRTTRDRILRRLADASGEVAFDQLLPDAPEPAEGDPLDALRRRSAWSSTFAASLELAKQGDVVVAQAGPFQPIHLAPV
jgi:segregation and condensation protein A